MKSSLLLLLLCLSLVVHAGEGSGKAIQVMAHDGNVFMFITQNHVNKPTCSTHGWAVSLSTESGKAMFSLVLAAHAQGKSINVLGKGSCSDWGDREAPRFIYIQE